jgi:hypothetical protein
VRLSPSEIAQRRKDNKCFKCEELFTSGHREHRKQLFIIEVVDEETEGLSPDDGELTISIHALTGIQPHASRTMAILVSVNDAHLITLLDLGSTHNFIDNTTTSRAGVTLARLSGMRIAVANGDKLVSSGCCHHMAMMVHGEQFHIDCYGLPLGSFDMVLGVQWLESLGPILWDFRRDTLAFVHNGHRVLWTTAASGSIPPPPPVSVGRQRRDHGGTAPRIRSPVPGAQRAAAEPEQDPLYPPPARHDANCGAAISLRPCAKGQT